MVENKKDSSRFVGEYEIIGHDDLNEEDRQKKLAEMKRLEQQFRITT